MYLSESNSFVPTKRFINIFYHIILDLTCYGYNFGVILHPGFANRCHAQYKTLPNNSLTVGKITKTLKENEK